MDVRLKVEPFELNDKIYHICCNMNVLADVQEAFGGDFMAALQNPAALKTSLVFLAAMLNDSADTNGWPERYSAKELGRMIPGSPAGIKKLTTAVSVLVKSAVLMESTTEVASEEALPKN